MPNKGLRERPGNYLCGLANWHPQWMQRYATTKTFMAVYGLLGTIQAMSYMYFVVTLTTIEKRFKIPSQTTGIILSGNEISQILLSLILSYIGGQRNRPRWIAWGIVFCGLSCYILALPHFIYGPGEDALQLTKEYADELAAKGAKNFTSNLTLVATPSSQSQKLCGSLKLETECDALVTIVPLILIFLSQFVLGIGNTLYYSLGQTYLDDNTKKTNTPLMLAVAMALRMIGPIFGFFIGFVSLNMFIDPSKTPLVDSKDPRWLGAWWFGWTILGTLMVLFSGLIGLFPKQLPKQRRNEKYNSHMPQVLRHEELPMNEGLVLSRGFSSTATLDALPPAASEFPTLKNFPKALMRLLRNKLLIYNIMAAVFYILGATGYMTFLSRYMEVQFHKSAHSATIVVGPVSIIGMIIGLIGSGIVISKKRPSPSKVLFWNVIVGGIYIAGQLSYTFMYCPDNMTALDHGKLNLMSACNANCSCENVPFSPVCHEPTDTTYYSPCHAGCSSWNAEAKMFSNCSCLLSDFDNDVSFDSHSTSSMPNFLTESSIEDSKLIQLLERLPDSRYIDSSSVYTTDFDSSTETFEYSSSSTTFSSSSSSSSSSSTSSTPSSSSSSASTSSPSPTPSSSSTSSPSPSPSSSSSSSDYDSITTEEESLLSRSRRAVVDTFNDVIKPGVCVKNCNIAFWGFAITSMIVNWFGSSGRIGNLLVNYRAVSTEDKSFAQGLSLMMISLLALIPGPIIFGRIIDSTCLVWTETCNGRGNCQLYDQARFRYLVNGVACLLTAIGVIFDVLVWYYGRHLDLYGEKESQRLEEELRKTKAISPLLAKK